jgi:peptidoglycan/xylan/chitin deacetylase (PgdA/CDA1 family)
LKFSVGIKSIVASFLHFSGILRLNLSRVSKDTFIVLMYHRIVPAQEAEKGVQSGMYVDPVTFRTHVEFLQKYFAIVPIAYLSCQGEAAFRNSNEKPLCVLTFDDGWYDFYEYAFPILKENNIPATVFLPTNFMGTNRLFWTDRLAFFLKQRENSEKRSPSKAPSPSNTLISQLDTMQGNYEAKLEKSIETLKSLRDEEIEEVLSELSSIWNVDPTPQSRAFLSWEEIKEMHQSGLITFGSHTASHKILTTLTDNEIQEELKKSKEKLIAEDIIDPSFIPFCYPNGNYNEKIAKMVKEAGYSLAVTTRNGWNDAGSDFFTLRRIGIHQDMTSTKAMFACRIAGIF